MTVPCTPMVRTTFHNADRWARAVVSALGTPEDPKTFERWARVAGASSSSLAAWCRAARVPPRNALYLARLLRACELLDGDLARLAEVLDVAETRTAHRMLMRAGLDTARRFSIHDLVCQQRLVIAPEPVASLLRDIAHRTAE